MTRLLCMYGGTYPTETGLDPRVEKALLRYAPQAGLEVEWIDTTADRQIYADELEKRWLGTEPVIVVEQDKEIFQGQLDSLLACPEPWCGHTFWINPVPHTVLAMGGFGFVKFSPWMQQEIPVSEFRGEDQIGIDRRFWDALLKRGIIVHLHGHVVHHHVYEPRPEIVRRHVADLRRRGIVPPAVYPEPADPGLLPGSYRLE